MTPSSPRSLSARPLPVPARRIEAAGTPTTEPRRYSSAQLFGDSIEVEIQHGDAVYRLRRTSLGKLILTK